MYLTGNAIILSLIYPMFFYTSAFISPISSKRRIVIQLIGKSSVLKMSIKKVTIPKSEYWEGDWVCADCGYIYDAYIDDHTGQGRPFEEMEKGFVCPQCSAPRKRYAKAVNGKWGVTNDGGDFPIYAMTFAGLVMTIWFSLAVVPSL